ncbi:MAG: ubiquitin-like small modifier protein 1 [Candidatus Bipolaricaulota bacterium]
MNGPEVTVRLFASLQEPVGAGSVTVQATDVGSMVEALVGRYPALGPELVDESGELRSTIKVMVNGRNVEFLQGLATPLTKDDAVAAFPLVAGG